MSWKTNARSPELASFRPYDPKAGSLAVACHLSYTVVPHVLKRVEFWFFLGIQLTVYGFYSMGFFRSTKDEINWDSVKVLSAITVFFEVFFVNQCFDRYSKLWGLVRNAIGAIYDFAFNARLYIRPCGQPFDRTATRWVMANFLLFMYELQRGGDIEDREWAKLQEFGLVKRDEVEFLRKLSSKQRSLVMLHTAGDLCRCGLTDAQAPPNVVKEISANLLSIRSLLQDLLDLQNFPIPFVYFHLLNFMIVVNLMMWAYGMGITLALWAPISFFFTALIFLGMMDLASLLANPFGDDSVDFPMNYWLVDFSENLAALMDYEHDGAKTTYNAELEDEKKVKTRLSLSMAEVESILCWNQGNDNAVGGIRPAEVIQQKPAAPADKSPSPQQQPLMAGRSPPGYSPLHMGK